MHTLVKDHAHSHMIGSLQVLWSHAAAKFSPGEEGEHISVTFLGEETKCLWSNPHAIMVFLWLTNFFLQKSCRYCKGAWANYELHDSCFLLNFVGMECLQNIAKVPRNWDTNLTPFNKVSGRYDKTNDNLVGVWMCLPIYLLLIRSVGESQCDVCVLGS